MTEQTQKSGLLPALALLCTLLAASCVQAPSYYRGQTPGGGYYVAMSPPSWQLPKINWGLVKMPRPQLPGFLQGGARDTGWWNGDGMSGSPRIHIRISEQKAYFYKGGQLAGVSPICTGSPDFPTPKGSFKIIEKDEDHLSSVYGDYIDQYGGVVQSQIDNRKDPRPPGAKFDGAKMNYFMRVVGGVGMHEGYLPGYADSHGCIRLPTRMAQIFFQNASHGTPVKITD